MSDLPDLAAIVRHCDTAYLDQHFAWDASPADIAAQLGAAVRAEALAEVEARLTTMTTEADQQTEAMEDEGAGSASLMYAQYAGLRRARDAVRQMAAGEEATPTGATATPGGFFVAGRTYLDPKTGNRFVCRHLAADPLNGRREAWGWVHRPDGSRRRDFFWADDYPQWEAHRG